MNSKDLFEEFRKRECLYDVLIETHYSGLIPFIKIISCESACCDHRTYIEVHADDVVDFNGFRCSVENLELLTKAINMLVTETWGIKVNKNRVLRGGNNDRST